MGNLQEMLQASWPILLMIIIFYFYNVNLDVARSAIANVVTEEAK